MSVLIVLENFEMPEGCRDCPFLVMEEDIACCDLLSINSNKAVTVNKYSTIPSSKCPMHMLDKYHGRILDERDIRAEFSNMPFGNKEIKFSILDVIENISGVNEIAPRYIEPTEKFKKGARKLKDAIQRVSMSKEDIEKEIENAGEDSSV